MASTSLLLVWRRSTKLIIPERKRCRFENKKQKQKERTHIFSRGLLLSYSKEENRDVSKKTKNRNTKTQIFALMVSTPLHLGWYTCTLHKSRDEVKRGGKGNGNNNISSRGAFLA